MLTVEIIQWSVLNLKKTVELSQLKIPKINLPDGYVIKKVELKDATEQDKETWKALHEYFRRTTFPTAKERHVVYILFKGEPVATS